MNIRIHHLTDRALCPEYYGNKRLNWRKTATKKEKKNQPLFIHLNFFLQDAKLCMTWRPQPMLCSLIQNSYRTNICNLFGMFERKYRIWWVWTNNLLFTLDSSDFADDNHSTSLKSQCFMQLKIIKLFKCNVLNTLLSVRIMSNLLNSWIKSWSFLDFQQIILHTVGCSFKISLIIEFSSSGVHVAHYI